MERLDSNLMPRKGNALLKRKNQYRRNIIILLTPMLLILEQARGCRIKEIPTTKALYPDCYSADAS